MFTDPSDPILSRTLRSRYRTTRRLLMTSLLALALSMLLAWAVEAQDASPLTPGAPPAAIMTLSRLAGVLVRLDPELQQSGGSFRMTVEDVPLLVVTDPRADRMRAMVPIRSAEGLSDADLLRMMQANFDSALDARYAVAEGRVWAVFIHPLSPLREAQLISGIGQTVNTALSYGTLYSSGAGQFGRGDSPGEQQKLLERLQERGQDI